MLSTGPQDGDHCSNLLPGPFRYRMELIPIVVIMGAMWALLIVPQQRRAKAHRQLLAQLEVGDEVLTSAGIYGEISDFDGPTVFLAVADNVEIKVTKASVTERVVYDDTDSEDD